MGDPAVRQVTRPHVKPDADEYHRRAQRDAVRHREGEAELNEAEEERSPKREVTNQTSQDKIDRSLGAG